MNSKYLVKKITDFFGNDILVTVFEVLKTIETEYGTVVIYKYTDKETWYIETAFLYELQEDGYKFSDDEKYNNWVNT